MMKSLLPLSLLMLASIALAADDPLAWPPATKESRPWSYCWWLGSAVDRENLTRELTRVRDAGWGGLHVVPIYGAKGWEPKFIDYLSPQWMDMLRHAVGEARRLGMDLDMTTGTGWPFGGPHVTPDMASSRLVLSRYPVAAGARLAEKLPPRQSSASDAAKADGDGKLVPGRGANVTLAALVALSEQGALLDLTDQVGVDGQLDWTAPPGAWQVFAVARMAPIQRVKRAAPGAEGSVLDPFSPSAMRRYLARFDAAFAGGGPLPRAQYHDSFEYFTADGTPQLLEQFAARRGYDLRRQLPAFSGQGPPDTIARVKCDYRQTMSELHLEYLRQWADWARGKGCLTRNQAHGSPGNILDHYATADIPETEIYANDRSILVAKFASSAAHVTGKRLVAAEAGTWLADHFTETLAALKTLLDEFFVSGVNHVVFHGTVYSPDEAPWPGWLFYAATQLNPRNAIWRDVPALAAYVTRCQSVLQSGAPDNDLLLYWPVYDVWHNPEGTLVPNGVHHRSWFEKTPVGDLAERLWKRGFAFDLVSDAQLAQARADGQTIRLGASYRAVVVPPCQHMPVETLAKLVALAEAGATVIFCEHLPRDVPGLADLDARRQQFRKLLDAAPPPSAVPPSALGKGRTLLGDAEAMLTAAGVRRETMTDRGLMFLRRALADGHHYFLVHRGQQPIRGWLPLERSAAAAVLLDPLSGRTGVAALRTRPGGCEVFVQLQPGQSLIVRLFDNGLVQGAPWPYREPAGDPLALTGSWQVQFIEGGPELPPAFQTDTLGSWTARGGAAERFAGTARYRLAFDAPAPAGAWLLDLGAVAHSARVRLNGRDLGTLFAPPFQVVIEDLTAQGNVLDVEVTNLSANRIRDLDRRGVKWRYFYDINFISLGKAFDASNWPLADSGLLGPVTLRVVSESRIE